jgi:cell division protein FtsB
MKWLKSTTDKSYTAQGKIIPPSNSAPLAVSDSLYESIASMKVIASLIKTGGIIVLDKYNDPQVSSSEQFKLQQLQTENTKLNDRIRELESSQTPTEVAEKAARFDELKAEAEQTIASKDAEIEKLKAELAKAKKSSKKDSE